MGEDVTGDRQAAPGTAAVAPAGGADVSAAPAAVGRQYFTERLWPSAGIWVIGAGLAATAGLVFYPAAGLVGVAVALAASIVVVVAVMVWWSATVRVVEVTPAGGDRSASQPWLQVGRARIPLSALGRAHALSPSQWSTALGTGADARSYRFVRGWIPTGVYVDVVDDRDPVPSWLVSSRRPADLVAAIDQARSSSGQTAP